MDLRTKLALALVSASLLSMAALGSFTYWWARDMFVEDARRQLDAVADSKEIEVRGVLARWNEELRVIVRRVQSASVTPGEAGVAGHPSREGIARVLRDIQASDENIRRLRWVESQGSPAAGSAASRSGTRAILPDDDVSFGRVEREPDGSISAVFHAGLTLAGRRLGGVEVVFDASPLVRLAGRSPAIGKTAATLLVVPSEADTGSGGGRHLVLSPFEQSPQPDRAPPSLADGPAAALRGPPQFLAAVTDQRGHEVVAATRFLPESGLGIVVQLDRAEARQQADSLRSNMTDLGVSLAAFAVLGGTLFGIRLGRPIKRLVQDVDRIRHGEVGLRLAVKGEDEVAFLAQSLNEFMNQLDRSSDLFRLRELGVLVVEGDDRHRQILEDLLRNWNLRPTLVTSGASALREIEQADRAGQPLQLVLLAESIPDADALVLAEQLRSATSEPRPIILVSSNADALDADRLSKSGIARVLPKPVIASHLMESILDEMGVAPHGPTATTDVFLKKTTPRRILLAEDHSLMQQVTTGFLENWGHEVSLAGNGREAVEAARRERFDVILMDVEMPEMNGLEAAAAIRAQERAEGSDRTPIIALTAEALSGDRERCLAAGMDHYIAKPADPKALYALIERAAAQAEVPAPAADEDPFDWALALSHVDGNEALLYELVELFARESRAQLELVRSGIEQRDAELLARGAHTLKGAAQVFGATAVVEVALSLETLGRRGELAGASELLETLEIHTRRLNAALTRRSDRRSVAASD
jgi:CheY-like chemotaxis protein/HPt (histidine-containing phosphotransfer) domain-containing protein